MVTTETELIATPHVMKCDCRAHVAMAAPDGEFLTLPGGIRSAAHLLSKSPRKMYRQAQRGELNFCVRVGGEYLIPMAAWRRWLATAGGNFA